MLHSQCLHSTQDSPESIGRSLLVLLLSSLLLAGCGSSSTSTDDDSSDTSETSEMTDNSDTNDSTDNTDDSDASDETSSVADADFEATDWTEATHTKDVDPNFDEVFDDTQVKRLDFVVTEARWQSMLDDMTATYGLFGQRSQGQDLLETDEDPIFVPAEVFYNGKEWYRVGIRFKGNSSLQSSWQDGILKLSFKMDFDEYEDDYPQIKNQRFYGFKKFSLKNTIDDI